LFSNCNFVCKYLKSTSFCKKKKNKSRQKPETLYFRLVSFSFVSFRFVSFRFVSFRFVSWFFLSIHFVSEFFPLFPLSFVSFLFQTLFFRFVSQIFSLLSFRFLALDFLFRFFFPFRLLSFLSYRFVSFHFWNPDSNCCVKFINSIGFCCCRCQHINKINCAFVYSCCWYKGGWYISYAYPLPTPYIKLFSVLNMLLYDAFS
jgi:hypothetical protein